MGIKPVEAGVVFVSLSGIGLYEFLQIPVETRVFLCNAAPWLVGGALGIFLFLVKETKRISRGG